MKMIFMGTPGMAVPLLGAVHQAGHSILAVVSQPDRPSGRHQVLEPTPIKRTALDLGLPLHQPEKIRTEEFRQWIESLAPEIVVVVAYGRILPGWLLGIPKWGCVNVHFSLLPKYRGAAPMNWAIARGEQETGVTTMLMDEGMDTGPILLQRSTPIGPEESAPQLAVRLAELGRALLLETLEDWPAGKIEPRVQDHATATLAPLLKREDGLIDWRQDASAVCNRVRGFQPWPGAWTTWKGARLLIWSAHPTRAMENGVRPAGDETIGRVFIGDDRAIRVGCGGGTFIEIQELQLEGKRKLGGLEFLNGNRLGNGERLGV